MQAPSSGRTPDTDTEQWHQTIERVVNGTFNMQRTWMVGQGLPWDSGQAQAQAQVLFVFSTHRTHDPSLHPPPYTHPPTHSGIPLHPSATTPTPA